MRYLVLLLVAVIVLAILTSCGAQDRVIHNYNVAAHDDCVFYGFTPGTAPFAYCMMHKGAARPNAGFR